MTYKRRAHTRTVNGKTVHVKASVVKGGSSSDGFWAGIFGKSAKRSSPSTIGRIRDRIEYERESYRLSGQYLQDMKDEGYFDDCAKHGRNYIATCRTCARIQSDPEPEPVSAVDQWAALDAIGQGEVPQVVTLTKDHEDGWKAGDQLCQAHGTGYNPGCLTCRKVAGATL